MTTGRKHLLKFLDRVSFGYPLPSNSSIIDDYIYATETSLVTSISRTFRFQPFRLASDRNVSEVAALRPEMSRIVAKTLYQR
jgi:hypothetical protein